MEGRRERERERERERGITGGHHHIRVHNAIHGIVSYSQTLYSPITSYPLCSEQDYTWYGSSCKTANNSNIG